MVRHNPSPLVGCDAVVPVYVDDSFSKAENNLVDQRKFKKKQVLPRILLPSFVSVVETNFSDFSKSGHMLIVVLIVPDHRKQKHFTYT